MNVTIAIVGIWLSLLPGAVPSPKIQIQPVQMRQITHGFPKPVSLSRQLGEIRNQIKAIDQSA